MNNSTADPWMLFVEKQRAAFRKYQLIPISIVIVVGFVANAMVIYSGLKKNLRRKYNTNSFILNLAVADLGVILYFIPIHIVEFTVGLDISDWTCKYIISIRETFLIVSIFTVAELGMVRFLQFHSYLVLSKRVTYFVIVITWLFAYLAISLPISLVIRHTPAMTCDHFWEDKNQQRLHIGLLNTVQFIPLLVTTICYSSIIRKVRRLQREHRGNIAGNELTHNTSHELSILMLMLIITAWWSFGPFLVFSLLSLLEVAMESPLIVWSAIAVFLTSASAINPVWILLMNKDYRNEIRNTFYRRNIPVETTRTTGISGHPGMNLYARNC